MGVVGPFLQHSKPVHGASVYSEGKRIAHVTLEGIDSPYPGVYGISQRETEALLTAHLAGLGVAVERKKRLETLTRRQRGGRREWSTGAARTTPSRPGGSWAATGAIASSARSSASRSRGARMKTTSSRRTCTSLAAEDGRRRDPRLPPPRRAGRLLPSLPGRRLPPHRLSSSRISRARLGALPPGPRRAVQRRQGPGGGRARVAAAGGAVGVGGGQGGSAPIGWPPCRERSWWT